VSNYIVGAVTLEIPQMKGLEARINSDDEKKLCRLEIQAPEKLNTTRTDSNRL
jgi:hypothetical protein